MSRTEQRRIWVLTKVLAGELTLAEVAELLGLTERSTTSSEAYEGHDKLQGGLGDANHSLALLFSP